MEFDVNTLEKMQMPDVLKVERGKAHSRFFVKLAGYFKNYSNVSISTPPQAMLLLLTMDIHNDISDSLKIKTTMKVAVSLI
jgi:hypothetical protein